MGVGAQYRVKELNNHRGELFVEYRHFSDILVFDVPGLKRSMVRPPPSTVAGACSWGCLLALCVAARSLPWSRLLPLHQRALSLHQRALSLHQRALVASLVSGPSCRFALHAALCLCAV